MLSHVLVQSMPSVAVIPVLPLVRALLVMCGVHVPVGREIYKL